MQLATPERSGTDCNNRRSSERPNIHYYLSHPLFQKSGPTGTGICFHSHAGVCLLPGDAKRRKERVFHPEPPLAWLGLAANNHNSLTQIYFAREYSPRCPNGQYLPSVGISGPLTSVWQGGHFISASAASDAPRGPPRTSAWALRMPHFWSRSDSSLEYAACPLCEADEASIPRNVPRLVFVRTTLLPDRSDYREFYLPLGSSDINLGFCCTYILGGGRDQREVFHTFRF